MVINYILFSILCLNIFITIYLITLHYFKKYNVNRRLRIEGNEYFKDVNTFDNLILQIKNKLLNYTSKDMKRNLLDIINISGTALEIGDLIFIKLLLSVILIIISSLIIYFTNRIDSIILKTIIITLGGSVGFIIPDFIIKLKIKKIRRNISRTLAAFIDFLAISVEAGLSLDLAILRVIKQIDGPLSREMAYTINEIKYGKTKKEAFKSLSTRINVLELSSFLSALINGETLGISMSAILKNQGQQIRENMKRKIQEQAYKIPVKLVFPLVLFILPGIFIILLGPAVINIFNLLL